MPGQDREAGERATQHPEHNSNNQKVRPPLSDQEKYIQSLKTKNDIILKKLEDMGGRLQKLDTLENLNINLKGEMTQVRSSIEEVVLSLNTVKSDLDRYEEKWQAVFKNLSDRVTVLENDAKSMDNKWDLYRESVAKDVRVLQSSIDSNSKRVISTESIISLHKDKWDSLNDLEGKIKQAADKKFSAIKTAVKIEICEEILEEVRARPSEVTHEDLEELKNELLGGLPNPQPGTMATPEVSREDLVELKKELSEKILSGQNGTAAVPEVTQEDLSALKKEMMGTFQAQNNPPPKRPEQESLKGQAFAKRHNLLIFGIQDGDSSSRDLATVRAFFARHMGLHDLRIHGTYRLGQFRPEARITRPLVIQFADIRDRWLVWNNKSKIRHDVQAPVRLSEDVPRKLREDLRVIQRIAKIASLKPEIYGEVRVRDYCLILNGNRYGIDEVSKLPSELQPESVYTPRSKEAVVFFTKQSPLSNHFPTKFSLEGQEYASVEQFLACAKARLAGNKTLEKRASEQKDPSECKRILNLLRGEIQEKWEEEAPAVVLPAIRAKFQQNEKLADFLIETYPLAIGEASRDSIWGTGLTLEHKDTLDTNKWEHRGNLLGYTLTQVRNELMQNLRENDKACYPSRTGETTG